MFAEDTMPSGKPFQTFKITKSEGERKMLQNYCTFYAHKNSLLDSLNQYR